MLKKSITVLLLLIAWTLSLANISSAVQPIVAAGSSHSLMIKPDGTLWAWGRNDLGQLGLGDSVARDKPVQVGIETTWKMVVTGDTHTIALKNDGTVWGWGNNSSGQVGDGTQVQRIIPTQVKYQTSQLPLSNIAFIAAGPLHSFAIGNNGTIWAWGNNLYGQLGDGTSNNRLTGAYNLVGTGFKSVSAGTSHTLATKTDGTLWAWGDNSNNQLGYTPAQLSPRQVGSETSWAIVAAGYGSSLAIKTTGTLWGWGSNYYGQLGLNIALPDSSSHAAPTQEATFSTWNSVKIGPNNSVIAIRSDNTIWGWGYNSNSELGLGDTTPRQTPTAISSATTWSAIAVGSHGLAVKFDGSLFSWGTNYQGALGDGSLNPITQMGTSRKRPNPSGARITINDFAGLELKSNGAIWSWGDNSHGNLGAPGVAYRNSPEQITDTVPTSSANDWVELSCAGTYMNVAMEPDSCAALKRDGSLWTWGYNTYGAIGLGSSLTATVKWNPFNITNSSPASTVPWSTIATAPYRGMGIRSDGTLWGWGANESAQMGTGTTTQLELPTRIGIDSNWWRISISQDHSLGIKTNGELWAWGNNTKGKLGNGNATSQASPVKITNPAGTWTTVSAGLSQSLGIMSDGTLWAWGNNANCQLGIGGTSCDLSLHVTPAKISTATDWIAVSAGAGHSMALKADGSLYMWGDNMYGQFGTGATDTAVHTTPVQVQAATKFANIATGSNGVSIVALTTDGTVKTWGVNTLGQLGNGTTDSPVVSPATPGFAAVPTITGASLSSSNFDSTRAAPGSIITLNMTASQKVTSPTVTFNGNPATSINSTDGGLTWTSTYNVTSSDIEGTVSLRVGNYSDLFNPNLAGIARTTTSDLSSVTIDKTLPVVSQVHLSSSNSASTLAKPGDIVTVSFTVSELLDLASVTIAGVPYQASCPNKVCSASHTTTSGTAEGIIPFSIQVFDLAGNASSLITLTSDGSSVTFDKTPPTLSTVAISSNHSPASIAKINSAITLSFSSLEPIVMPSVAIAGHAASVSGSGTTWSASYTMQGGDNEGSVPFSIAFSDLAGNAGGAVSSTTNGSSVTFQKKVLVTIPAVSYGTLTPGTPQWIDYNNGLNILTTPNPGCTLTGISGCNGTLSGSTYVISSLTDDCAITAGFLDPVPPVVSITSPADSATLTANALQTMTGSASDPGSGISTVKLTILDTSTGNYLQANNTYTATPAQLSANVSGATWSFSPPAGVFADKTTYQLTVIATDMAGNTANAVSTFTKVPSYENTRSNITSLVASQSRIATGNSITVSGVIERYSSYNDGFIGKPIYLDIYAPGDINPSTTIPGTLTSNNGLFSFNNVNVFNTPGSYKLTARFPATTWLSASSFDIFIQVGPKAGYAIVVQGQVTNDTQGAAAYNKTVKRAIDRMKTQGLATDYLNNDPSQPQDVRYFSFLNDRTHEPVVKDDIRKAITIWAAQKLTDAPAPLYIVLIDHGSKEPDAKIYLDTESITPAELAGWLNTLEGTFTAQQLAALPERVIVVGSCYSGSFINPLSSAGRVIISSAAATEESARGFKEGDDLMTGEYFVDQLFAHLERGKTFKEAFNTSSRDTAMLTRTGTTGLVPDPASIYHDIARQHPLLDDNGDHAGLNLLPDAGTTEGQLSAAIRMGIGRQAQLNPTAEILATSETILLPSNSNGLPIGTHLWVELNDPALMLANTYPIVKLRTPTSSITGGNGSQLTYSLIEYQLSTLGTCVRADGTQTACYSTANGQSSSDTLNKSLANMFVNPGIYEAYYYVIDKNTLGLSPIHRSVIYKSNNTILSPPLQIDPQDGTEQKTALSFSWSPVTSVGKYITYTLLISTKADFSTIDYRREELVDTITFVPMGILKDLATYYWKVRAVDQYGNIGESYIQSFTTNNRNGLPAMVKGYVTDSIGTPIEGAEISDGSLTATSLTNGAFLMAVDSAVTSLSATASNYSPKQVSVSLTPGGVTEVLFMLTPPVTTHTLALAINGIGRVYQTPTGLDCYSDNTSAPGCQTIADNGTGFSLLATTGDWRYLFSSWNGVTCSNDITNTATLCTFTLAAPTTVTATFGLNYQARISATPYVSLQTALNSATNGATVEAMAYNFQEPILFNRNGIEVTIDGGRGKNYAIQTAGYSTVNGLFRIQQGTIRIKGPVAVK